MNYARADQDDLCFTVESGSKPNIYELFKFPQPSRPPLDPSLELSLPSLKMYVFRNGVRGDGPNGFQRPILERSSEVVVDRIITRLLVFVSWANPTTARELLTPQDILTREAGRELSTEADNSVIKLKIIDLKRR